MDASEKNEIPMLSDIYLKSESLNDSTVERFSSRTRSLSMSITMNPLESCKNDAQSSSVRMSGPIYVGSKNEFIFQPPHGAFKQKTTDPEVEKYPSIDGLNNDNLSVESYVGKNEHLMKSGQLGMCSDPYCTTCQMYYNVMGRQKYLRTPELVDAKFHNMLYGNANGWAKRKCSFLRPYITRVMNPHTKIVQQWNKFFVISCLFAVLIDPLFFFLLSVQQFRLAYVAPESRVMGAEDLVDEPKKIALNYFFGYFIIDFFVVLPLPQIIILMVLPDSIGTSDANEAKNLLRASILVHYIPRLYRFLPLLAGQSSSGLIFESAWANFIINLLTFMLASHVVGSCLYLFGLQQISTLAGNHVPSYFVWEVLFTVAIIVVGLRLLLFALLIGNMQNFLQSLGRRNVFKTPTRHDVAQWMSHRRLPEDLRRR